MRDQLVIYTNFHLPRRHRLLDELTASRDDISRVLNLPTSDEPINIYLFHDESRYRKFMETHHPSFPDRRALFIKNDTELKIYAYWGDRTGEDLRHEVTHGYIHSVVPNMPLWLDEGLAEYFEVGRGKHGFNRQHIIAIGQKFKHGEWTPDLQRLEALQFAGEMTQLDYAESWLWVHFLLESGHDKLIQDQLARLRMSGEARPISKIVDQAIDQPALQLVEHLKHLVESL